MCTRRKAEAKYLRPFSIIFAQSHIRKTGVPYILGCCSVKQKYYVISGVLRRLCRHVCTCIKVCMECGRMNLFNGPTFGLGSQRNFRFIRVSSRPAPPHLRAKVLVSRAKNAGIVHTVDVFPSLSRMPIPESRFFRATEKRKIVLHVCV